MKGEGNNADDDDEQQTHRSWKVPETEKESRECAPSVLIYPDEETTCVVVMPPMSVVSVMMKRIPMAVAVTVMMLSVEKRVMMVLMTLMAKAIVENNEIDLRKIVEKRMPTTEREQMQMS